MTSSAGLRGESEDALIATAIEHRDAGFGTLKVKVKVKVGAGGDDVSVLRRVRAEVGAGIGLRVDANQGWTAEQAVSVISAWEDTGLGIEMVNIKLAKTGGLREALQMAELARHTSAISSIFPTRLASASQGSPQTRPVPCAIPSWRKNDSVVAEEISRLRARRASRAPARRRPGPHAADRPR